MSHVQIVLARLFSSMNLDANQTHLLRYTCTSIGVLAVKLLSGPELGSVVTFSMVIDSILLDSSNNEILQRLKKEFSTLSVHSDTTVGTLFQFLFRICDLACKFDREEADDLVASLLSLSPVPFPN